MDSWLAKHWVDTQALPDAAPTDATAVRASRAPVPPTLALTAMRAARASTPMDRALTPKAPRFQPIESPSRVPDLATALFKVGDLTGVRQVAHALVEGKRMVAPSDGSYANPGGAAAGVLAAILPFVTGPEGKLAAEGAAMGRGAKAAAKASALFREVHPTDFHAALKPFLEGNPELAMYHTFHAPEAQLAAKTRTFLSPDGMAGFAVAKDGDLQNVFNHGDAGQGARGVAEAIGLHGAKKLDNLDNGLARYYRRFGFHETGRFPFNPEEAPAGWDAAKHGEPDYVMMAHAGTGQHTPEDILKLYADRKRGESYGLPAIITGKTDKVTAKMESMREAPEVVQKRIDAAYKKLREPLPPKPEPLGILDRSMLKPDAGPNTEPLPVRPSFGDRASSAMMLPNATPENLALVKAQAERGLQMMPDWSPGFYASYPAVRHAIERNGGDARLFRNATSGAAIRSGVENELIGGTNFIHNLQRGAISWDEMHAINSLGGKEGQAAWEKLAERMRLLHAAENPQTRSLMLMGAHPQSTYNLYHGLEPDSFKIPTYDGQKEEAIPGFVFDTHESKGGTLASPFHNLHAANAGFGSEGPYGFQEALYRPLAQQLGVTDRVLQEARWRGGGGITKLKTHPTADYAHIFEDLVHRNAAMRGMAPQDFIGELAQGRMYLTSPKSGLLVPRGLVSPTPPPRGLFGI